MEVKIIKYPTDEDWIIARNNALITRRQYSGKVPNSRMKMMMLASEHSPIRSLEIVWEWIDLPSWVSVHFVRHHIGITPFVSSQRNDIQHEYDRRKAPQDSPVNHRSVGNVQAIMNIAKARECLTASNETRQAWDMFMTELDVYMPELVKLCVPHCVYRGGICPELFSTCRYNESDKFYAELEAYKLNFVKGVKRKVE